MNLPKGDHVISTRTQQIWKGDDGIVRAVYIPGADPTLDDAKANIAADLRAAGTDRFVLLVDYAGLRSFRRDVRVWLAGPEVAAVIAAFGILVASPLARIIANFFMGLNEQRYPRQMFADEDEAVAWLRKYVE